MRSERSASQLGRRERAENQAAECEEAERPNHAEHRHREPKPHRLVVEEFGPRAADQAGKVERIEKQEKADEQNPADGAKPRQQMVKMLAAGVADAYLGFAQLARQRVVAAIDANEG